MASQCFSRKASKKVTAKVVSVLLSSVALLFLWSGSVVGETFDSNSEVQAEEKDFLFSTMDNREASNNYLENQEEQKEALLVTTDSGEVFNSHLENQEEQKEALLAITDSGDLVASFQKRLQTLGFYQGTITGYYGEQTQAATKQLQAERGLQVSGNACEKTLFESQFFLYQVSGGAETFVTIADKHKTSPENLKALNNAEINIEAPLPVGESIMIPASLKEPLNASSHEQSRGDEPPHGQLLSWSTVNGMIPRNSTVEIKDLKTGNVFIAKRLGGSLHADMEPATSQDTAIMHNNYSGSWSWNRRAVIVKIEDQFVAASMNGMPHGVQNISNNNFPGHFCLHFYGSATHRNRNVDSAHQAAIMRAAGK